MFYLCSYMSKHLDGRPKLVNPVWYRKQEWLHLACRCRHRAPLHIGALALQHELASTVRLYQVVERMGCHRCGRKPVGVEVKDRRR